MLFIVYRGNKDRGVTLTCSRLLILLKLLTLMMMSETIDDLITYERDDYFMHNINMEYNYNG